MTVAVKSIGRKVRNLGLILFGTRRLKFFQAHLMGDVVKFLTADRLKLLAAGLELFIDLDGLFGHRFVGILCAAKKRKVFTGGNPFMTIGIQPQTYHGDFAFLVGLARHQFSVMPVRGRVKTDAGSQEFAESFRRRYVRFRVNALALCAGSGRINRLALRSVRVEINLVRGVA